MAPMRFQFGALLDEILDRQQVFPLAATGGGR